MPNLKWYQKLTPEELWNEYIGNSVELFVSFFHIETIPVTDVNEMCKIYAGDICNSFGKPYSVEQRNHIEGLLKKYINDYIEGVGGYDKLKILTREEVEVIEEQTTKELMDTIEWYKNSKGID